MGAPMLWLIFALMVLFALALLLVPLLRVKDGGFTRAEHDIAVYRDQLSEVAAEKQRGLLGDAEAKAAELEIARRLLRADAEVNPSADPGRARPSRFWTAAIIAVVLPLIAVPLYFHFGDPGLAALPSGPPPPTSAELAARTRLVGMVEKLKAGLEKQPENLQGWLLLGRSEIVLKRYQDAIVAFYRARKLAPKDANIATNLGEAEMIAADGQVTPRAAAQFQEALALDPKQPGARYYLGLAKAQSGNIRGAFDVWLAMVKEGPKDAPWMPTVAGQLKAAAAMLHIDLKQALAATPATSGPAPTAATPAQPKAGATVDPADKR